MKTTEDVKEIVKQKYSEIALQDKETNQASCCGAGGCSTKVYNIMTLAWAADCLHNSQKLKKVMW